METLRSNLYDHPAYYDLVFGSDWKAEHDFLMGCFEKHSPRTVERVFEPACGTGRLLYRLAKQGFQVNGLDLNSHAVEYCNARFRRHGLPETAFVGDMTDFRLKTKVDSAFNMINSFRHLCEEAQAEAHMQCMARALRRGGLYILGLHLTPLTRQPMEEESWSARRGNLCVNTRLQTIDRNLSSRRERFRMDCDVYTPTRSFRLTDEIQFRTYTFDQFDRLIHNSGVFAIEQAYDFAYDTDEPIEVDEGSEDVVYVLRRK